MRITAYMAIIVATMMFAPAGARAEVPSIIPIQGVLADSSGVLLDGDHTIRLRLYDSENSDTALFDETQVVLVEAGTFTVYLGRNQSLDLSLFHGPVYLGVTVGSDAEMTPRLEFGTVPYAALARECEDVPSGTVMFFDLATCPGGWTEFAALQGRVPVGMPSDGTLGGTVGTPLQDRGQRQITTVPAHSHTIDPPSANSSSAGAHTHTVDPAAVTTSSNGRHDHSAWLGNGGNSGNYNIFQTAWSNSDSSVPDSRIPISSDGEHTHTVDIPSTTSTSAGGHSHSVNIPPFNSALTGTQAVDVTMPYVQLLVCRKD